MNKNLIREENKRKRKTLNTEHSSNIIIGKIKDYEPFLVAKNVLLFYPLKDEINLLPLLEFGNKNFYFPRVQGNSLVICSANKGFIKGKFNIMEPLACAVDFSIIDIAFVPAIAIDKNFNRIGYGKGFYDRLFSDVNFHAKKIGVIQKELLVDNINPEKFDIPLDDYITG